MPQNADSKAFDAVYSMLMDDMIFSTTLREVAYLGIADLLRDGPRPVSLLAQEVGVQADVLQLFLRVLCSKDIFVETQVGTFANTEKSRYLYRPISLVQCLVMQNYSVPHDGERYGHQRP